jgi:VWFA-related protein
LPVILKKANMQTFVFRARVLAAVLALGAMAAPFAARAVQDQQPDDQTTTLRADVRLVNLFFSVRDKKGGLVANLTKDDFAVLEEDQPQAIKFFSAESNQPLTLGLLVDTSGSQQRILEAEKEIGAAFLRNVLRPKDLAFLISFDVNVDLLQDFTGDARELRAALGRARVNIGSGGSVMLPPGTGGNPVPTAGAMRGTLLYDAIYLAAREKLASEVGRKALIILTDGVDMGSRTTIQEAIEAAHKSDAIVYVLLVADRDAYRMSGYGYSGEGEMKKLTKETGGRTVDVGDNPEKLKKAFDEISQELRSQYNIGYTSTNPKLDGSFREVEIKAKGYKVQSRKGYYATAE